MSFLPIYYIKSPKGCQMRFKIVEKRVLYLLSLLSQLSLITSLQSAPIIECPYKQSRAPLAVCSYHTASQTSSSLKQLETVFYCHGARFKNEDCTKTSVDTSTRTTSNWYTYDSHPISSCIPHYLQQKFFNVAKEQLTIKEQPCVCKQSLAHFISSSFVPIHFVTSDIQPCIVPTNHSCEDVSYAAL